MWVFPIDPHSCGMTTFPSGWIERRRKRMFWGHSLSPEFGCGPWTFSRMKALYPLFALAFCFKYLWKRVLTDQLFPNRTHGETVITQHPVSHPCTNRSPTHMSTLLNSFHFILGWILETTTHKHTSGHWKLRPFCELFLKPSVLHIMIFLKKWITKTKISLLK